MQYHEVRIVAELRKQGEHERAEEFRLRPCAVPPVASPSTWCPWLAPPCRSPTRTRTGAHAGHDDRHGEAA